MFSKTEWAAQREVMLVLSVAGNRRFDLSSASHQKPSAKSFMCLHFSSGFLVPENEGIEKK